MRHGDEVWVKGTWRDGKSREYIELCDRRGAVSWYASPEDCEWTPNPTVKDSLTAQSPLLDQLNSEADLREREADDREFRDRCAVAVLQAGWTTWTSDAADCEVAAWCYDMAEAMVAERRRRDGR